MILEDVLASGRKISWKDVIQSDEDPDDEEDLVSKSLHFGSHGNVEEGGDDSDNEATSS